MSLIKFAKVTTLPTKPAGTAVTPGETNIEPNTIYFYKYATAGVSIYISDAAGSSLTKLGGETGALVYRGKSTVTAVNALTAAQKSLGDYYILTVGGKIPATTGTDYATGDWAVWNGTTWDRINNSITNVKTDKGTSTVAALPASPAIGDYYRISNASSTVLNVGGVSFSVILGDIVQWNGSNWDNVTTTLSAPLKNPVFVGAVKDSIGNLRSIPVSSNTTVVAADNGKVIITSSGVTINASTGMAAGDSFMVYNSSTTATLTITFTSVNGYLSGDIAAKTSLTLANFGTCSVLCVADKTYVASGDLT
jgi:hypothetical protein